MESGSQAAGSTMCGCFALSHAVERRQAGRVQAPAVIESTRSVRTAMCGRCGTYLSVPRGALTVCCALCQAVTRVQRRPSGLEDFLKGLINSLMSPPEPPPLSSSGDWLPASYPRVPGRKRALLVGVGYTGTVHELKGTVHDVNCMGHLLLDAFGFPSESILVLTQEEEDPNRAPTMKNIRLAMRWLVQGCDTGDALSLVFYFAGHCDDENQLCAVDFEDGGVIPDSKINEIIVRPLGPGVKLHAFVETYPSGTIVLDLPYLCQISRNRFLWENQNVRPETPKGTNGGVAISISGCRDSQNPATRTGSAPFGAMTFNLIKAVESGLASTYGSLINAIRADIRREPQLRASEPFGIRKPFILGFPSSGAPSEAHPSGVFSPVHHKVY